MLEYIENWIKEEKNPIKRIAKKILFWINSPILKTLGRYDIAKMEEMQLYKENVSEGYQKLLQSQECLRLGINECENGIVGIMQYQEEMTEELKRYSNATEQQNQDIIKLEKRISDMEIAAREDYSCIDYFDFENKFRGSIEDIKNRQKIYLSYFKKKHNVYDLGCGRGEFVELLQENKIGITGVDLYQPFVDFCRERKLNVICNDALEALRNATSVDGIFLGQLVEHISTKQLVELLSIAYEKLEPGCYLIIETPNPVSLAIYTRSFYVDPSHNKPVHPLTLQYLAEKAGFSQCEVLFTEGSRVPIEIPTISGIGFDELNKSIKIVSDILFGSQDYALIARK